MPARPLGHHELLLLLFQLAALLLVARLGGELCRKIRVPAVVGELTAGVVLGPTVFGAFFPGLKLLLFPPSQLQSDLLSVVTWLGVIFLLLVTGLETDLALIRRMGRKALLISGGGILVPFGTGMLLGYWLPAELLVSEAQRGVFALFVATAMSISAIPVIARILLELGVIRRDISQLTLAAGMLDDTIGWMLLSVVAGLASGGALDLWIPIKSVGAVLGVLLLSFTLGRPLLAALFRWVDDHLGGLRSLISLTGVLVLVASGLTLGLGLEAVLGAFVLGILLRETPRYRPEVTHSLEEVTQLILAPIFFAAAGLKVDLTVFTNPTLLFWALLVLGVACFGKFVGVQLGARAARLSHWASFSIGAGMNARGAMEIIVATIGLSLGVLTTSMYSIIVFVAIATSLMAPPLLRFGMSRVSLEPEEAARLQKEEKERRSFWSGVRRILLPTRGGGNVRMAAGLLTQALGERSVEVTVLNLQRSTSFSRLFQRTNEDDIGAAALETVTAALQPLTVRARTVNAHTQRVAQCIAEQAQGHDLVVLGATEERGGLASPHTFGAAIDELLQTSALPVLVVRSPGSSRIAVSDGFTPLTPQKILVPSTGTREGQPALELGITLAQRLGAQCTVLTVREEEPVSLPRELQDELSSPGWSQLEQESLPGVTYQTLQADRPGRAIVEVAEQGGYDLIVLNARVRSGTRQAYLGPQVDHVVRASPCPVAILITH